MTKQDVHCSVKTYALCTLHITIHSVFNKVKKLKMQANKLQTGHFIHCILVFVVINFAFFQSVSSQFMKICHNFLLTDMKTEKG